MSNRNYEPRAKELLEIITPDLLRMLGNAPSYGSCGFDVFFHNSEIARIALRAEYLKLQLGKAQEEL